MNDTDARCVHSLTDRKIIDTGFEWYCTKCNKTITEVIKERCAACGGPMLIGAVDWYCAAEPFAHPRPAKKDVGYYFSEDGGPGDWFSVRKNGNIMPQGSYHFRAIKPLCIFLGTNNHYVGFAPGEIVPVYLVNPRSELEYGRTVAIEDNVKREDVGP